MAVILSCFVASSFDTILIVLVSLPLRTNFCSEFLQFFKAQILLESCFVLAFIMHHLSNFGNFRNRERIKRCDPDCGHTLRVREGGLPVIKDGVTDNGYITFPKGHLAQRQATCSVSFIKPHQSIRNQTGLGQERLRAQPAATCTLQ